MNDERSAPWVGPLAVLGAAGLWALLGVWSRELDGRGADAVDVAWWRAAGGGACFALHAALRRAPWRIDPDDRQRLAAFTLFGVSVFYAAVPQAVSLGGVTLAFVLMYTAPVWVLVGTVVGAPSTFDRRVAVLVSATVAGVAMVVAGGGGGITVSAGSVAWGVASGLSYASYYLVGRGLFEGRGAIATYAVALPLGALPLGALAGWRLPAADQAVWVLGLVVASTYLPYQLLAAGLRRVPPTRAVVIATVEPVAAAVLAWAVYDERISPLAGAGAAVVIVSAALAALRRT